MPDPNPSSGDEQLPAKVGGRPIRRVEGGTKIGGLAPALEIRFEGRGISPDKVLVPDLAQVIRAVQRLTVGQILDESKPLAEEEKLRLIKVRRGSAIYAFAGPVPAIASSHLRILGEVIDHPERIGENDYVLHPVGILSRAALKLQTSITIREPGGGAVLARIGQDTYENLTKSILIRGATEFGGKVERVGGATRSRCGLRVAFQKRMLICRVPDPAVARTLGENLYRRVVASGEATWVKTTWRVFSFRVDAVRSLDEGSLYDKIKAIRDAGGSDWDKISDVRAYLDDQEPDFPIHHDGRGGRAIGLE